MKSLKLFISLSFFFLLLSIEVSFAQNPTEWPYGGVPDTSRYSLIPVRRGIYRESKPLNFNNPANFWNATFNSTAEFRNATFDSAVYFWEATFNREVRFDEATFDREVRFDEATFNSAVYFWKATFNREVYFCNTTFNREVNFWKATFNSTADFQNATFDSAVYFWEATFNREVNFWNTTFDSAVYFWGATFNSSAGFCGATFNSTVDFEKTVFVGKVDFFDTDFKKGADFRLADFDEVDVIYLDDIKFPDGELLFNWEQFKGKDSLRITLSEPYVDSLKKEEYKRIEIIYHKLRDNFLAQGDKSSADKVMYELCWQRDEILKEFHWQMYGFFFGYGYEPWRFLLFVVAPIIIVFAFVWYWFYYAILIYINPNLFPKIIIEHQLKQKEKYLIRFKNIKLIKLRFNDLSEIKKNTKRLTSYWHALHFSTSVLLGIRFKKEWTKTCPENIPGRKSYIYFITFEWVLGIGLFIAFALLVEGIRFGFIKDLLGF